MSNRWIWQWPRSTSDTPNNLIHCKHCFLDVCSVLEAWLYSYRPHLPLRRFSKSRLKRSEPLVPIRLSHISILFHNFIHFWSIVTKTCCCNKHWFNDFLLFLLFGLNQLLSTIELCWKICKLEKSQSDDRSETMFTYGEEICSLTKHYSRLEMILTDLSVRWVALCSVRIH